MAGNRTLGIKVFRAWPSGRPKAPFAMDSVEGVNLLDVFGQMNAALQQQHLDDREKRITVRVIKQTVTPCAQLVTYRRGVYGDSGGDLLDEVTGKSTHTITPTESIPQYLRCALVVVPGGGAALLFTEHDGSTSVATPISDELKATFVREEITTRVPGKKKGSFDDVGITLDKKTHQDVDAWKQGSHLLQFRVIRQKRKGDFEPRGIGHKVPATLAESDLYLPASGHAFADKISQMLFGNAIEAATHLALDDPESVEGIEVTREKDGKTRTYMLGTERVPTFRRVLTTAGMSPLSDPDFMDAVREETEAYFEKTGLQLSAGWLDLGQFRDG